MSLSTVNNLRLEASNAVESAVEEAKIYVQNSKVVGADETSFVQGNVNGCNSKKSQGWLWVCVTALVTFFEIALSRCSDAARNLLGENFSGFLNSDRYAATPNWVGLEQRQLCWAHLKLSSLKRYT
jgi:transposase